MEAAPANLPDPNVSRSASSPSALEFASGRLYTQSDPIGLAGGINTYTYVDGNPLTYVDPDGRVLQIAGGAVVGGVLGAVGNGFSSWTQGNGFFNGQALKNGFIGGAICGQGSGLSCHVRSSAGGAWSGPCMRSCMRHGQVSPVPRPRLNPAVRQRPPAGGWCQPLP